jgi:predicted DNA-binding transcriptional regulator AlpA
MERLIKISEVENMTSLDRSDIYKRMKSNEFPRSVKTSIGYAREIFLA